MLGPIKRVVGVFAVSGILMAGPALGAGDPPQCKQVRFSDVGWSCITATTAIASKILEGLGYKPKATILSVPVTFVSLKNKDIDAFLGLWMPTQTEYIQPYFDEDSIEKVTTNLTGAKYTLAVPKYVYDSGVREFGDLQKFKKKFGGKIYGIEPGNDGNKVIHNMIEKNAFELGGWKLVQSSEQAMLSQVARATRRKKWIVFLGWEPHPMNRRFRMAYLGGGDDWFGPNFGGATVHTLASKGYTQRCANVGRLLENLTFTLDLENRLMGWILDEGMDPEAAAEKLLKENPELLVKWLEGVTTLDGNEDALAPVKRHLKM